MESRRSAQRLPLEVITPLCASFSKQADWLLQLHEMAQGLRPHPGRCVTCFYALLGAAGVEKRPALEPLRHWIEENLEIAIQAGDREAGKLPVQLESADLESYCAGVMRRIREDAVIEADHVELSFRFKSLRAA